jgi:hypothetical protein
MSAEDIEYENDGGGQQGYAGTKILTSSLTPLSDISYVVPYASILFLLLHVVGLVLPPRDPEKMPDINPNNLIFLIFKVYVCQILIPPSMRFGIKATYG